MSDASIDEGEVGLVVYGHTERPSTRHSQESRHVVMLAGFVADPVLRREAGVRS
jgi:hypothetical protein